MSIYRSRTDDVSSGWEDGANPRFLRRRWLDLNWTFAESLPTGQLTGFEVGVVLGDAPGSDSWLLPPFTVGPEVRRALRAVSVDAAVVAARAAVRPLYGRLTGPWTVQGAPVALSRSAVSVATQAAMDAVTSDGILSRAEKPGVIIEVLAAESDWAYLSARAASAGIGYSDFGAAWSALQTYLAGLWPAYSDTSADTAIDAVTWRARWGDYYHAWTALVTRLSGAPPCTVAGVSDTNWNLTTNATQPTIDGVLRSAGDLVMLRGQTDASRNGLYVLGVTSGIISTSMRYYPASGTASGEGTYVDDGNAYDNEGLPTTAPFNTTYATLISPENSRSEQVIFAGWSGVWTRGQLCINLDTSCEGTPEGAASVAVAYSVDGGLHWATAATYQKAQDGGHAVVVDLEGVTPSMLRVRVLATGYYREIYEDRLPGEVPDIPYVVYGTGTALIRSIYFTPVSQSSGNWYFSRQGPVLDGTVWSVAAGSSYGGKTYNAAVSGNTITLSQTTAYSQPFDIQGVCASKPAAAQKIILFPAPRGFRLLAAGHAGKCYINPTATATFTVKRNGTSIGSCSFGTTGTFTSSITQTDFAPGDILTLEAPGTQDATLADVGITLKAHTL